MTVMLEVVALPSDDKSDKSQQTSEMLERLRQYQWFHKLWEALTDDT